MHWPRVAAVLTLLSPTIAQQTWNVPVGASVDAFLAQASPGDVLLLGTGSYGAFVLDKGVTVLGTGSGVSPTFTFVTSFTVQIPAGQRGSVCGLHVSGAPSMTVSGTVSFDDITLTSNRFIVNSGNVVMQRMRWNSALHLVGGTCSVSDSTFAGLGGQAYPLLRWALPGVEVSGGTLSLSRCTVQGGIGDFWNWPPTYVASQPGIYMNAHLPTTVRLTDCTLIGGNTFSGATMGAPALIKYGTGLLELTRTTFVDGPSATSPSAATFANPLLVGMSRSGPPTRGASFTATATASNAQDFLAIVGGFGRDVNLLPPVVEPLYGNPLQLVVLDVALPLPGGTLATTVAVPNLAALQGAEVWLQALQLAGSTIRASTVVGGTIR